MSECTTSESGEPKQSLISLYDMFLGLGTPTISNSPKANLISRLFGVAFLLFIILSFGLCEVRWIVCLLMWCVLHSKSGTLTRHYQSRHYTTTEEDIEEECMFYVCIHNQDVPQEL